MSAEFRLIPTRRSTEGAWLPAWTYVGDAEGAIRSATDFCVPVLVRQRGVNGVLTESLGVYPECKLRKRRVHR